MLSDAIGNLLPSAIGVALSPVPIIAVILILGTPKARTNGPVFAVGWVLGLVIVSVIVLFVVSGSDTSDTASTTVSWGKLLLGVLFLLLAAKQWKGRPKPGETAELPKWMAAIDQFAPGKSFLFGGLLSGLNPKNLALTAAVAASIAQAGLSSADSAIAVGVFVIIGSITVAGPVVFFMFASKQAAGPLDSIKTFMGEHNAVIMMVVLLILGAKLIGDSLPGLTN